MTRSRTHAGARPRQAEARPVSRPDDLHEREAERAAEVVARGGSVSDWSFSAVPASAPDPVQRQEVVKPKSDDEKKKEAATKVAEAVLETPAGKAVKEKVLADPLVKTVKDAATSPAGLAVGGVALAGGVAALGAAKKPLPFQPPAIPLDRITPGLSGQVKLEGPVNAPTFVGLTLTYKEQGPKGRKKTAGDEYAAETARLKAQQELFKPTAQKAAEKQQEDEAVQAWIRSQRLTLPLTPGAAPRVEDTPKAEDEQPKKDEEKAPVQPAPASPSAAPPAQANVDDALSAPGRPLDPSTRRTMEARFGYDFSGVRVHDDARAAATAAGIDAAAFAVGEDVVFGTGRYDPAGDEGRRLLAHELAHVVQGGRGGRDGSHVSRQVAQAPQQAAPPAPAPFTDPELRSYLELLRRTRAVEGGGDSPRKARELIARWSAGAPDFAILTIPERVLLVQELVGGARAADSETAIFALLVEALPEERLSILWGVGEERIRAVLSPPNLTRFDDMVRSSVDDAVTGLLRDWTVADVVRILDRHGDGHVIDDLLARRYRVISFETAFDRWRYDDGHREEQELTGLRGNTDRDAREIRLRSSLNAEEAASTLFHEIRHAVSPEGTTNDEYLEDEISARVNAEEFRIRHGMGPSRESYRRADGTVDEAAIRREIRGSSHYNPTGRSRIGRRYVGEHVVGGWRPPRRGAGQRP